MVLSTGVISFQNRAFAKPSNVLNTISSILKEFAFQTPLRGTMPHFHSQDLIDSVNHLASGPAALWFDRTAPTHLDWSSRYVAQIARHRSQGSDRPIIWPLGYHRRCCNPAAWRPAGFGCTAPAAPSKWLPHLLGGKTAPVSNGFQPSPSLDLDFKLSAPRQRHRILQNFLVRTFKPQRSG
jgi:hypothetical protein